MENLRKHPAPLVALLGTVIAGQSLFWEYARVRPDYRFIVDPWSVRGYDLVQGRVITAIAICVAILVVIAWRDVTVAKGQIPHTVVGAAFIAASVAIAAVAGSEYEITLGTTAGIGLAVAGALITTFLLKNVLGDRVAGRNRRLFMIGTPVVLALVGFLAIVQPLLIDESFVQPVWVLTALVVTPLVLLGLTGAPRELATNRLLILAVLGGWGYTTLSAGAVRTTLLELQEEVGGVAAQYKDLQITSGMVLAFVGLGIAFLGAVAMWAQRRDQLIAQKRAAQQRAAAAKSAAELAEALELLDPEYR